MSKYRKRQMSPERRAMLESMLDNTSGQESLSDVASDMMSLLLAPFKKRLEEC